MKKEKKKNENEEKKKVKFLGNPRSRPRIGKEKASHPKSLKVLERKILKTFFLFSGCDVEVAMIVITARLK